MFCKMVSLIGSKKFYLPDIFSGKSEGFSVQIICSVFVVSPLKSIEGMSELGISLVEFFKNIPTLTIAQGY